MRNNLDKRIERNIVGSRVRQARARFKPKLTQEMLAARLQLQEWNINRQGVAKVELGIREITDIELMKLAKTLEVSVNWLLGEQE